MTNSVVTFEALKDEYQLAVMEHRDTFTIGGKEILTEYAKYLILYLGMLGAVPSSTIRLVDKGEIPTEAHG